MLFWEKKKLLFRNKKKNFTHTQLPVSIKLGKTIRIFYSSRDKFGRSNPFCLDLSENLKITKIHHKPLLNLGDPGTFDDMGIMPTCIFKIKNLYYLYYIGWNVSKNVPYSNNLGLAVSKDCLNFKKLYKSPILQKTNLEPYFFGTANIYKKNKTYLMFYLSCNGWLKKKKKYEPIYDIKIAKSQNGINWYQTGLTAIKLKNGEGGISSSSIIKHKNDYLMYYSVRKKFDYRKNKKNSYRIGLAKSKNLYNWSRTDKKFNLDLSKNSWDSEMMAYPNILKLKKSYLMFYNGNGFGKSGLGVAVAKIK